MSDELSRAKERLRSAGLDDAIGPMFNHARETLIASAPDQPQPDPAPERCPTCKTKWPEVASVCTDPFHNPPDPSPDTPEEHG